LSEEKKFNRDMGRGVHIPHKESLIRVPK